VVAAILIWWIPIETYGGMAFTVFISIGFVNIIFGLGRLIFRKGKKDE